MDDSGYRVLVHRKTGTTEHTLRDGRDIVFGRDPTCTVTLTDTRVSRRHAVLRQRAGHLEFTDLGSRNGCTIDGDRVEANVAVQIRPTSVIRLGDIVVVFEDAQSRSSEQWCFDASTFDKRAAALFASSRSQKAPVGLIEIRWRADDDLSTTTAPNAPPTQMHALLGRIVGHDGVVGAHESGRLLLLLPKTQSEKIEASAAIVKRICDEHDLSAEVRTATTSEAQSVQGLLEKSAKGSGASVPPVYFQGGLHSVDKLLTRLDASDAPVLIVGETGVGKDVLARRVHQRSRRANKPYVALNCAAFTEALFESELFGHERGAFTGAAQAKTGLLESAAGGTVFLDEIGEMPLGLQAKLLRVVENREVLRVGALQPKQVDVRFLFATNRDLREEIERKTFRSDLFFRIGSITLKIPPLRERIDEVAPLALHFIEVSAVRLGKPVPRLMPEARRFLEGHAWPGNVRELKNVVELAVLIHEGDVIRPSDIHIDRFVANEQISAPISSEPEPRIAAEATTMPGKREPSTSDEAPQTERERMLEALERTVWNQSAAAKLLGMPRRTFVKRLAQYDLPRPRKREP